MGVNPQGLGFSANLAERRPKLPQMVNGVHSLRGDFGALGF